MICNVLVWLDCCVHSSNYIVVLWYEHSHMNMDMTGALSFSSPLLRPSERLDMRLGMNNEQHNTTHSV